MPIGAWHAQLIEILGAMGLREVRRLRGERGRAMVFEDLEREIFGPVLHVATFKARYIDRVVDAASNTFGVRLEIANPEYEVPGGVRCDVRFLENS